MAGHGQIGDAWAENTLDQTFNWPVQGYSPHDFGSRRSAPAELPFRQYDPNYGGWWQRGRRLKNFRPNYYYTRPCDGKRRGTMGRLKDAMTSEGPDVFVTISGDKRTLMKDRPQRWQWTGWGLAPQRQRDRLFDRDWRPQDDMDFLGGSRAEGAYNFRNRKFEYPRLRDWQSDRLWTDAHWPEAAKRSARDPLSKRYLNGVQTTRVPWDSGWYPGGRPLWNM
ncbi:hypothetical protein LTR53_001892 [Teratosphaeriaceae sp. CCFEE 6253]|nr:hypothetical protein LTR53_001892 [Teratosphaeriaceae sp. CCFEE 6253]